MAFHHYHHHRLLMFSTVILFLSQAPLSTSWFLFSPKQETHSGTNDAMMSGKAFSEFSMEALHDPNGVQLIGKAKIKMQGPDSCWQAAYENVFGDEDKIFLKYFLETTSICHQLQSDAFKRQTERLVNELKSTAEYAEVKLEKIEEQGELLLQNSKHVHESLASIDLQTQQVAKTSRVVEDRVSSVLKYSEKIHEQSKGIEDSQVELREGQVKMKESLVEGMVLLENSYKSLGVEIVNMRNEAAEIEKEIGKVGDAMSLKMSVLSSKADDIGDIAGTSLDKQKQLLDGQSVALEGLNFLTKFQSQALEESRETLQRLAEFGHKQQEELLQKQKQLHQSHDQLVENSKLIIAAQEAFESKQASMFLAIDKLFSLHSAMLFESRVIITFFVYSIAIFIIYMLTSIKQAYNVRHRLYLGLCVAFFIEVIILWYITTEAERQGRIIHAVRSLFWFLASVQYLYAIFTYRDYEVLNHQMLLTLMEKVNIMQSGKGLLSWDDMDADSEVNWSSWVDTELPEEYMKRDSQKRAFFQEPNLHGHIDRLRNPARVLNPMASSSWPEAANRVMN
ncbi:Protein GAMETE EXPRESSED 1 [Striga hermonthica]|uniref:Protein GAMETE EXPRESSED 1 n=1 Tax=Striga hermonthica TaxID=68872 RepID=A0A9N7NCU1_STRHE|nr:Protein GAMETE EXPRESSED 1 [Striga hermonthica]